MPDTPFELYVNDNYIGTITDNDKPSYHGDLFCLYYTGGMYGEYKCIDSSIIELKSK